MIHLSLRNVEWDVEEDLILTVSLSMKKTARRFSRKKEKSLIHSSTELWQISKSN